MALGRIVRQWRMSRFDFRSMADVLHAIPPAAKGDTTRLIAAAHQGIPWLARTPRMRGHPIKTTAFPFFWIRFASPKAGALRLGCDKLWLAPRLSWPSLRSGFFQGARAFGFGCGAAPPGCGYPPSFLLAQKRGDPEPSPWVPGGKSPDAVTPEFWYVQNSGTPYNGSAPPESGGSRHTRDIQMLGYCCVSFVFLLGSTWRP